MKKMNVIPLIMSVFMLFSCAEQEQIEATFDESSTVKSYQEKVNYISMHQLIASSIRKKIFNKEQLKKEYLAEIEKGNKDLIVKLEELQKDLKGLIEELEKHMKKPPKCPVPCQDEANCIVIGLANVKWLNTEGYEILDLKFMQDGKSAGKLGAIRGGDGCGPRGQVGLDAQGELVLNIMYKGENGEKKLITVDATTEY